MPIGYLRMQILYNNSGKVTDYKYLDANPAFYNITASPIGSYIGHTAKDFNANKPEELEVLQQVVSSGKVLETNRLIANTGRQYHILIYLQGQQEVVALFTDISERMKTNRGPSP